MSGYCKYYKQKKQVSYDNGVSWTDTGDYQKGDLYETNSTDCGYVGEIYRWINLNPSTDYYCSDTTKYYKQQKQVSYDGGSSWTNVSPAEYQRGSVYEINSVDCGYEPPSGYSNQYLTFVALEDGTFKFSGTTYENTVQYSLDSGSTWTRLASNTNSPTVTAGNEIWWKGTMVPNYSGIGNFYSTGQFDIEGNIMSLLYGDNFSGQTSLSGKNNVFLTLFSGCTRVISAQNLILPATTLSNYCYTSMFYGCTNLTAAPELPALTMKPNCYYHMFYGCSSLVETPELPATWLAQECYLGMFENCSSITSAPELSVTTLQNGCYWCMFRGCSSLASAPALPATTLKEGCYAGMFQYCTSLTTAPDLLATTLVQNCYGGMFDGCTNLSYIKCLATSISATNCTSTWVLNVAPSGTFVKNSDMSSWRTGRDGIPSGWTVQNA